MDERLFDNLARTLALGQGHGQSRRRLAAWAGLGAASLGLAGALGLPGESEAKKKKCKKKKKKACVGKCGPVTYRCKKKTKTADCGACAYNVCPSGCAYTEVHEAINAASPGATIRIGPGTYKENIYIEKNITLIGAGAGKTIIDGKAEESVIGIEPGLTAVTIRDMTLTNGKSSGVGGGISNGTAQTTLINLLITKNIASERGGGFDVNIGGKVTVQNCTISNNHAGQAGGGTYTLGTVTCTGSTYSGNTSGDPAASDNCTEVGAGTGCNTCVA
ncbi:MAG: hypothetical protein U0Z70_14425 [Thermomicrobiales bacterium]